MKCLMTGTHAPDEVPDKPQQRSENGSMIKTSAACPVESTPRKNKKRFGEMAGGTAAECAAVCCCCPCALMDFLVLAVVKVPAGLCKKARRRQCKMRKKKRQQSLLVEPRACAGPVPGSGSREELEREIREFLEKGKKGCDDGDGESDEALDVQKEMWGRFWGTGFWRSPSQREAA